MQSIAPECPTCGAPLRLASDHASGSGLSRSWICTDSTCPTVVPAAALQGERGDLLGAPVEVLMRAPVTPTAGGSGNGRSRRQPKPGDREAMQARRERRYLDQEPAGGRDQESERGCDRLTSQLITVRLSRRDAGRVRALAGQHGSVADVLREALDIMEALCGSDILGPLDVDPQDMV